MNILEFTFIVGLSLGLTGFLGAPTGLGDGTVLVPVLTLLLGVDIHYAIGASLVSMIATSSGAAAAYVKEGFTNIRIGMFLEVATTIGALIGTFLAAKISTSIIAVIFGTVLLYSAYLLSRPKPDRPLDIPPDPLATRRSEFNLERLHSRVERIPPILRSALYALLLLPFGSRGSQYLTLYR